MADPKMNSPGNYDCFKEAVCIDAGRIFDSCADKDCLEDLQVYFTGNTQPIIDASTGVKCRKAEIINVFPEVEPVPFHRGFYSVDITFFFDVHLDAYASPASPPKAVRGLATFSKKVILYGSEGNVRIYSSDSRRMAPPTDNLPAADVQVVEPICLSCRLMDACRCRETPLKLPPEIVREYDGSFCDHRGDKTVYVTLGIFTIVQLRRNVQLMVPAYDYCIPEKECACTADDPCELFRQIHFPTDEFFPPCMEHREDTPS